MRDVAQSELFDAAVSSLEITDDTDQKLAQAALVLYVSTDDFTALHGVTGSEAISSIRPWIDDDELLSRFAFQALTAAYLSIGAPPLWSKDRLDQFDGFNESDPLEVASIAAFNNDEQSRNWSTPRGDCGENKRPLYLAVAARRALPIS